MKINENLNYVLLTNAVDKEFLKKFSEYPVIDESISFSDLKTKLEFNPSKRLVFNNTFYNLRDKEKKEVVSLLNKQNIKFILLTSDIEDGLFGDYIIVYDKENIILEGLKETVLKEEKTLKILGYGLPFVVDLSTQLNYYDIFDRIYYNMDELVDDLWN